MSRPNPLITSFSFLVIATFAIAPLGRAARPDSENAVVRNSNITLSRTRRVWTVKVIDHAGPTSTLEAGDKLLSVAGRPASGLGPLQLNWILNQAFTSPLQVSVRRGGATQSVVFIREAAETPAVMAAQIAAAYDTPAFHVPIVGGRGAVSDQTFRGKWLLLNFWGTYCGPCKLEAPILTHLATSEPDKLKVVAIAVGDSPDKLKAFVEQTRPAYTVADVGEFKSPTALKFGVGSPGGGGSVPMSVLLAPNGSVAYVQGGFWQPSPLEQEVHHFIDR
jgi:thiol-disulfide isomerase/thioredoxin